MKCQGSFPNDELQIKKEGKLLRIFFDLTSALDEENKVIEGMYDCENINIESMQYGDIVSAIIRSKYAQDTVEAILSNYEDAKDASSDLTQEKREEYSTEYTDYQNWRKHAKDIARQVSLLV